MKGIRHLFTFNGRAGRAEYFLHSIADVFVIFLFAVAFSEVSERTATSEILDTINLGLFLVVFFGGMIAEVCVTVRRFHDLGRPGSHFFHTWIPIYNIYLGFVLLLQEGQSGTNDYGPPRR